MNNNQDTSKKLYFITNKKGQYLNVAAKEHYWSDNICNGSYGQKKDHVQKMIDVYNVPHQEDPKYFLYETTEMQFTDSMAILTTEIVISLDSVYHKLQSVNSNLPTISTVNKRLSQSIKQTSAALKLCNPEFRAFEKANEDSTYFVLELYESYIKSISNLSLPEMKDIICIIGAYHKDKSSIMGITKKIIK